MLFYKTNLKTIFVFELWLGAFLFQSEPAGTLIFLVIWGHIVWMFNKITALFFLVELV